MAKTTPPKTPARRRTATPSHATASSSKVATKAEVLETLFATQTKLLEAERQAQIQAETEAALHAARTEAEDRAERHEATVYEAQVDITILEAARDTARARLDEARTEVLALTRLLAEAQAGRAEMEQRLSDTEAEMARRLADAEQSIGSRTEALQNELAATRAQTEKLDGLERTVARQEQHLAAQASELAEMSRLLANTEARADAAQTAYHHAGGWLAPLIGAFLTHPSGDPFSEDDYSEYAARLIASGAFDPEWYLVTNPDVAESGTDPAQHFLRYGLAEGRAPRDLSAPLHPSGATEKPAVADTDAADAPADTGAVG